jgi:YVTN family beta-propeller protein
MAGTPFAVGSEPGAIAITPDGKTAYVTDESLNVVIPVRTATDTPGAPIPVGAQPFGIGHHP